MAEVRPIGAGPGYDQVERLIKTVKLQNKILEAILDKLSDLVDREVK